MSVGVRFSPPVQTGPEAHPTSYTTGTGSFPGVKRPGRGVDHPSHLAQRLNKDLTFASPCIIIRFKQINQQDATVSQVYYLTFTYGSTCFGRLSAHYQERTTALRASDFTVGEWQLERCCSCTTNNAPSTTLQR